MGLLDKMLGAMKYDDEEDYGSAYVPPRTAPKKEED